MAYEVCYKFKDLQDDNYIYAVGDTFPREGLVVSDERAAELSSDTNKIGKILILKIDEDTELNLEEMNVAELKNFAAEENIELPKEITKKDDIKLYITEKTK